MNLSICKILSFSLAALGLAAAAPAQAQGPTKYTQLYAFQYSDGNQPSSRITLATDGSLITATDWGGPDNNGVVFKLSPPVAPATAWTGQVLYSFQFPHSGFGAGFAAGPVFGGGGQLFGAAAQGAGYAGYLYRLSPPVGGAAWKASYLYGFRPAQPANGEGPSGDPIFGSDGALYGVASAGGEGACVGGGGCGVVYRLARPTAPGPWTQSVLYSFPGGTGGLQPTGPLAFDGTGALYGVTIGGGAKWGIVYKLSPPVPPATQWTEQTLYSFKGGADGCLPSGGVLIGSDGSLYGVASCGLSTVAGAGSGAGVVYRLTPPVPGVSGWKETVLYSFTGGADGGFPNGGLAFGPGGSLYGTTSSGGDVRFCGVVNPAPGCGVVFMLSPPSGSGPWTETVLHTFAPNEGFVPYAGVTVGPAGELYGTASLGGGGAGTIWRLQ